MDAELMPPPPPRRLQRLKDGAPRAVVPEEDFVRALGDVIERQYFPDLPKLTQQLAWLQAVESGDAARIARLRAEISESLRHADSVYMGADTPQSSLLRSGAGHSVAGLGSGATPLHATAAAASSATAAKDDDAESLLSWSARVPGAQNPPRNRQGSVAARSSAGSVAHSGTAASLAVRAPGSAAAAAAHAAASDGSTIDEFLARFASEDNSSFEGNFAGFAQVRRVTHPHCIDC